MFNIHEHCIIMNININKEEFIHDAINSLKEIMGIDAINVTATLERWYDSNIHINGSDFIAVVKNTVSPSTFVSTLDKLLEIKSNTTNRSYSLPNTFIQDLLICFFTKV